MAQNKGLNRRDFMKLSAIASVALPTATVVGSVGGRDLLESPEEYGGFYIRKHGKNNLPYSVDDSFQRADFTDTMTNMFKFLKHPFGYQLAKDKHLANNDPGFTRLDYAFMDGANTYGAAGGNGYLGCGGFLSWEKLPREDLLNPFPEEKNPSRWDPADAGFTTRDVTTVVKKAAKFYGASLSGIAEVDERWFYGKTLSENPAMPPGDPKQMMAKINKMVEAGKKMPAPPLPTAEVRFEDVEDPKILDDGTRVIPKSMKYAVVVAFEMDYDGIETDHSAVTYAATADGYSRMAYTTASLAEFFRSMGYKAIPLVNDTALSVPMAIDAGLGELGRIGVVVTPKYGPRVRLAKVLTDMPLIPDQPISFGVTEFCDVCGKCAEHCPSSAIKKTGRTYDVEPGSAGNPGILKWPMHGGKCFQYWNDTGCSCSNCIRVCPFNKPDSWLHEITRLLIAGKSHLVDKMLLRLDDASGYGKPLGKAMKSTEFWNKDNFIHIKEQS